MPSVTVDLEQLMSMVDARIDAGVRAALDKAADEAPVFRQVTGSVDSVDGSSAFVIPDDDPTTMIEATRMHPDIVAGSIVWLVQTPPAGAFVLGPIP